VVCFGGVTLPPFVSSLEDGRRGVFELMRSLNRRPMEDFLDDRVRILRLRIDLRGQNVDF
jgi:hypothetical protein